MQERWKILKFVSFLSKYEIRSVRIKEWMDVWQNMNE